MPVQGSTYTFEDLSGSTANDGDSNPYNGLLKACNDDATQIQTRYSLHRAARAQQQREKILAPNFPGVNIDPILRSILDEAARPDSQKTGYEDPRNCLVFWARPPPPVQQLIVACQEKLKKVLPSTWFMPRPNMHMTALEITHSRTPGEIANLIEQLRPQAGSIATYPCETSRQCILVKPMVTYDAAAMALSFLPAASADEPGLAASQVKGNGGSGEHGFGYSYHHLRRDLHELTSAQVEVGSRYVVPSAHLTIGRFVTAKDTTVDGTEEGAISVEKMQAYVDAIDEINEWLEKEIWGGGEAGGSVWVVGKDRGLDFHCGRLWYGGGACVDM